MEAHCKREHQSPCDEALLTKHCGTSAIRTCEKRKAGTYGNLVVVRLKFRVERWPVLSNLPLRDGLKFGRIMTAIASSLSRFYLYHGLNNNGRRHLLIDTLDTAYRRWMITRWMALARTILPSLYPRPNPLPSVEQGLMAENNHLRVNPEH